MQFASRREHERRCVRPSDGRECARLRLRHGLPWRLGTGSCRVEHVQHGPPNLPRFMGRAPDVRSHQRRLW